MPVAQPSRSLPPALSAALRFLLPPLLAGLLLGALVLVWLSRDGRAPTGAPVVRSYASAVTRAAPAVANIYTRSVKVTGPSPLCDWPEFRSLCAALPGRRQRMEESLGSAVVMRRDGYLLTNNHVIAGADSISVAFQDGRTEQARVVGTDPETDLAVLQVDRDDLVAIAVAASDAARVGDVVLAIGNPFGIGQTVSMGIVSAKGRYGLSSSPYEDYIQTDAAINPGNSGGALVDASGDLVGINSLVFSGARGSQGIGFAIPSDLANDVLRQIVSHGRVVRGWLGIEVSARPAVARLADGSEVPGLPVTAVQEGAPGWEAGVRPGDLVLAVNDQAALDSRAVTVAIGALEPGSEISLRLARMGTLQEVRAIAGQRPLPRAERR